jgi:membrane protease YdiL (CAAX protease family)
MSKSIASRVRELVFPSEVSLSADFPWDRGVLRTFGVILAGLGVTIVAPILVMLAAMLVSGVLGIGPAVQEIVAQNKLLSLMALQLVLQVVGFGAAIAFLDSRMRGVPLNDVVSLNLKTQNGSFFKAFGKGLLGWAVAIALTGVFYHFVDMGTPHDPAAEMGRSLFGSNFALLLFAVSTVFVAPFVEEIVFRGFFFNMLRRTFRNRLPAGFADFSAVVISAAIFAGVHGTLSGFPALFIMGMVMAEVYRRTGSLYASMAMHFVNNAFVTLVLILSLVH